MKPTDEQQAAIDAYRSGSNVVLEAGAGTGKTTALKLIARSTPKRRGLYLAFNKSVATEAQRTFEGTGVLAKTAHSLAFREFGSPRRDRLSGRMPIWEKQRYLGVRNLPVAIPGSALSAIPAPIVMSMVQETVNQFCKSGKKRIVADHVSMHPRLLGLGATDAHLEQITPAIMRFAQAYWDDVVDLDGGLPVDHDHYLKLWALSKPQLDVDFILFDEAQDADTLMVDVVRRQKHAQVISVGDRCQAIYGWRGATDALDRFGGDRLRLTQAFRFGDAIAGEANVWLELLGSDLRLRGLEGARSSVHRDKHSHRAPDAILCRTNAGVIVELMRAHETGVSVAIAGESRANQIRSLAAAALDLLSGQPTRHPDLCMFTTWGAVVEYSETEDGADLAPLVGIINTYGAPAILAAIDSCVPADQAELVVATGHVAKGLEWRHVRISEEDWREPGRDEDGNQKPLQKSEAMLAYVAVTRAKRHLDAKALSWVHTFTGGFV
ncbi:UvrD-helicase domain-containing protein [Agromyces subbeticus]|uniref:UvrD-helicase domain-containing protein n=1 Tax=Agromyces subbeticus TaxID=293890 RepID=UPI0003B413B5|nr:UvrD-helicase domain-containing protein [Agromyces subbeticus]